MPNGPSRSRVRVSRRRPVSRRFAVTTASGEMSFHRPTSTCPGSSVTRPASGRTDWSCTITWSRRAAGTETVIELHGTNARVICHRCEETADATPVRKRARDGHLPPRCSCGGPYKPDVVLFGELLPRKAYRRAKSLAAASDVFLVAGSSLTVDPAASLPGRAEGGTLAICNLEPTRYAARADYTFRADVTEVLPKLATRVDARHRLIRSHGHPAVEPRLVPWRVG